MALVIECHSGSGRRKHAAASVSIVRSTVFPKMGGCNPHLDF